MKNQKINGLILASTFAVGVASTNATATSAKLSGSIKDSKNSSKNDSKTANSQAIKNIAGSLTSGKLPVVAFGTACASLLACYAASCIKSSDDKETPEEKPEEEKDEPQKEKENDDKKSTSNLWPILGPILVVVVIIVIGFGIWCKTKIDFVSEDKLKSIFGISDDELKKIIDGDISIHKEYFNNNIKDGMKYLQLIKEGKNENKTIRLVANDCFSLNAFWDALASFLGAAARLLPNTVSGITNLELENGFWCCDDEGAEALSMNPFGADKINLKFIKLDEYVTFHKSILENKTISKKTLCKYIVKVDSMQQTLGNLKGRLFYSTLSPLDLIQAALDPRSNINEGVEAVKAAIANKFGKYVDALQDVDNGVLSEKNKNS